MKPADVKSKIIFVIKLSQTYNLYQAENMLHIFNLFSLLIHAYIFSTVLSVSGFYLLKKNLQQPVQHMEIANMLALIITIIFSLIFLVDYFSMSAGHFENMQPYEYLSLLFFFITCAALPLLFLFRRNRERFAVTGIIMAGLLLYIDQEKAILIITNFFRDYLPSSWSVYYSTPGISIYIVSTVLFFIAVRIIAAFLNKRSKQIIH